MLYEVGNGSRHTPFGVPEMLDTPPSHITSTRNKFFATAENFFLYTQKNSLPSEKLHIFKSQISFSDILSSCRTPSGLQATAPEMLAANIFLHLFSF